MATDFQAGFIALNRFGLGSRRDGDFAAAASDPRGFLEAELATPGMTLLEGPELPQTALALKSLFSDLEQKRLERLAAEAIAPVKLADTAAAMDAPSMQGSEAPPAEKPKPAFKPSPGAAVQVFRAEASARLRRALAARPGFVERLVAFWTNHFCVSTAKGGFVRISAGASSATRSGRMSSGAFATCCKRSRATRQCCSISTTNFPSGPIRRSVSAQAAASTRISRAKSLSCIHSA